MILVLLASSALSSAAYSVFYGNDYVADLENGDTRTIQSPDYGVSPGWYYSGTKVRYRITGPAFSKVQAVCYVQIYVSVL